MTPNRAFATVYFALLAACGVDAPAPDGNGDLSLTDIGPPDGPLAEDFAPVDADAMSTCNDEVTNGAETDIDCGGPICPRCELGKRCVEARDCRMGSCAAGRCATMPTCNDILKNGSETDIDCGGQICPKCPNGKACGQATDCVSTFCMGGLCSVAPGCDDKVKNGGETDLDCGGQTCPKCANGKACAQAGDCVSGLCSGGLCAAQPSCGDKVKNGSETDVDCGGPMCPRCKDGLLCLAAADCLSGVCVANRCGMNMAKIGFGAPLLRLTTGSEWDMAVGDVDDDRNQDVLVTAGSDSVYVAWGFGDGTLSVETVAARGSKARGIATADFNRDGKVEFVVTNPDANDQRTRVYFSAGPRKFTVGGSVQSGEGVRVVAADFNNDGWMDMAVINVATVLLHLNQQGGGGFGTAGVLPPPKPRVPRAITVADLNRDGLKDVVIGESGGMVGTVLNAGMGTFKPLVEHVATESEVIAVGDFNGDGKPDVVGTDAPNNRAFLLLGRGDGTLDKVSYLATGPEPTGIAVFDLNRDNRDDIVTGNRAGRSVSVLLGKGDGTFEPAVDFDAGKKLSRVAVADFNNDVKPDLVGLSMDEGFLVVLLNASK